MKKFGRNCMPSKDPAINRFHEEFDEFYFEIIDNVMAEAVALGKSQESVYAYRDPSRISNSLKACEIPYSTKKNEILRFLANKCGLTVVPQKSPVQLDGSVDDEWAEASELFGIIRHEFNNPRKRFDPVMVTRFLNVIYRLIEEWRHRSGK